MILVTGSAGYLGSHLCQKLSKKKIPFYSIDNFSGGRKQNIIKNKTFKKIDYSSKKITNFLIKNKITTIVHTAAYTFPNESEKNKKKYYLNNINKTVKFIKSCSKANIKNFIFFSTSNIYSFDKKDIKAANEKSKIKPENYYGYTKIYIEKFLQKKNLFQNLVILRIFNVAGFVDNFRFKEFKSKFRRIMPTLITAIKTKKIINIYGKFSKKAFQYAIRDYLHVEDFSNLIIKLLHTKNERKKIYNVGSGDCHSLKNVIDIFQKLIRKKIKFNIKELRKGELNYTSCNSAKVKKAQKWKPKKNLIHIVKSTIKWSRLSK